MKKYAVAILYCECRPVKRLEYSGSAVTGYDYNNIEVFKVDLTNVVSFPQHLDILIISADSMKEAFEKAQADFHYHILQSHVVEVI